MLPPAGDWHLLVDRRALDRVDGLRLQARPPTPEGRVLERRYPWEGSFTTALAVLPRPGGGWRLYYRAMHAGGPFHLAVAESDDGRAWSRPLLAQVPLPEHPRTNVILQPPGQVDLLWDDGPACDPRERVKLLTWRSAAGALTPVQDRTGLRKEAHMQVSADGLAFSEAAWTPDLASDLPNVFDGQNRIAWSAVEGCYVGWFRVMGPERTVMRATSPDLRSWRPLTVVYREPAPRDELYRCGLQAHPAAPHHLIGLGLRFVPGRRHPDASDGLTAWDHHTYDHDTSEVVLLTARPGEARLGRDLRAAWIRPGPEPRNWSSRTNAPAAGLFESGPGELSFLVHRGYAREGWWIERFSLPARRFASLHAGWTPGRARTLDLGPARGDLELDLATGAAGGARVGLRGARGGRIPGYELEACDPVFGDGLRRVTWRGRRLPPHLQGRRLRLEIELKDADLYAFRWTGGAAP